MSTRPISVLIAAMGGEGGGVMTDWIVGAAQRAGFPVQGTSIPGVAQRTGATTYYIELWPETHEALGGRAPVFGLGPSPGDVDVVLASELVEAGRCCERGFVSPERTLLVGALRRVYATSEKSAMGDGRFDSERVMRALREMPQQSVLFDPERVPGASLNAVMLGVLAASGRLPIPDQAWREAIRAGVAAEANLRGFEAGQALAAAPPLPATGQATPLPDRLPGLLRHAGQHLPPEVLSVVEHALPRLSEYQSDAYARLYLERLARIGGPPRLQAEVARQLALWMSYEDVVRVAQLKATAHRFAELRAEARAKPGEPVQVTEFLKPGIAEVASLLPPGLGRRLRDRAARGGRLAHLALPLRLRTDTVRGYLALFLLARLRRWRPRSLRYAEEQAAIEAWLGRIAEAASRGEVAFALEIAACAGLRKGYAETQERGVRAFEAVMARVVDRAAPGDPEAASRLARAREAALADPEHRALDALLSGLEAAPAALPRAAE